MNRGTYKLALNGGGTTRKCVMEMAATALKPYPVTIYGSEHPPLSVVNYIRPEALIVFSLQRSA